MATIESRLERLEHHLLPVEPEPTGMSGAICFDDQGEENGVSVLPPSPWYCAATSACAAGADIPGGQACPTCGRPCPHTRDRDARDAEDR